MLSGAGSAVAMASTRGFSVGLPFIEAIRIDWDQWQRGTTVAGLAANTLIASFPIAQGTWHVQVQLAYENNAVPGDGIVVFLHAPVVAGFTYDMCSPQAGSGQVQMEAIIAVGQSSSAHITTGDTALAAGPRLTWLFLGKRITR